VRWRVLIPFGVETYDYGGAQGGFGGGGGEGRYRAVEHVGKEAVLC
jgi:hypothetical protein